MQRKIKHLTPLVALLQTVGMPALADVWDIHVTVDNQFDVYFGTNTSTMGGVVGGGTDWTVEYHLQALGQAPTDYMYVATASDAAGAQGFIGVFGNTTTGRTVVTGDPDWQVFAAGTHPQTNPYWPFPWPSLLQPTQSEVDAAIAFAEANSLWVAPVGAPGYDNDPSTPIAPYGHEWGHYYPNMPLAAQWIWHDSGGGDPPNMNLWPRPLHGYNHNEFLIFRVAGVPAPSSAVLLTLGGGCALRRRRRSGSATVQTLSFTQTH